MDCKSCKEFRATVPYLVHEGAMARQERTIKRLWLIIIILILALLVTNGAWIWYESQWEYVEETTSVTQDAERGNNWYIGGDNNGEANSYENEEVQSP